MKSSLQTKAKALSLILILSQGSIVFAGVPSKTESGKKSSKNRSESGVTEVPSKTSAAPSADAIEASPTAKKSAITASYDNESSRGIREGQKANVDLLYTPLSDFVLQGGLGVSYNMKPDLGLGVHYLTGSKSISYESSDNGSKVTGSAKAQGSAGYAYGRYFFGNSFNMMAGLGMRNATIDYTIEESSLNLKLKGKIEIQSIAVPVFIGNRWTFSSGFTIGCDWVGAFIPLSGKAKSSLDGNLSSSTIAEINEKFVSMGDDLAHKTSITLLLTSIGWAF